MTKKDFLVGYKIFFGLLGFSAIVTEIATITERGLFNPANFFSFFTIQSNVLVFVAFLISALAVASSKHPRWLDTLRGAATTYIVVVGLSFSWLLTGLEDTALTAVPWDNVVLHYIVPIAAFIDLLIDRPKAKLRFAQSLLWLLYPAAYVAYTLIRGSIVGWYPYPFLDPSHSGYGGIAVIVAGLLFLSLALVWVVCKLSGSSSHLATRRRRAGIGSRDQSAV